MQKASLVLNIVLLVAVIYLFVKVNSITPSQADPGTTVSSSDTSLQVVDDGKLRIAFIVSDSINNQYEWLVDKKTELEGEEKKAKSRLDAELKSAANREKQIQADYKFLSLSEQQAAQEELAKLGQKLQMLEQQLMGELQEKEMMYLKQLNENVRDYVAGYAKKNNYDYILSYVFGGQLLYGTPGDDITAEIVNGLNAEYKDFKARNNK